MQTLQTLHLDESVLPKAADKSSLEQVHLPDLRALSVFDTVSAIEFFLHHVTFPPTTRTAIGCTHLDPVLQLSGTSSVLVLLKRLLSERPRALKLRHIELTSLDECDEIWGLNFKGWGHSSFKGYDPNFDANFTFFVEWKSDQVDILPPIDELSIGMFGIFPQDEVVSLSISSYAGACFRDFPRKIAQLPALHALRLSDISSAPFLEELDCGVPQEGDDLSIPTYPALQYLDLSGHEINVRDLTTLSEYLKKRSELGLGPEKLKMDLCGPRKVDKKATALLKKVVKVVSQSVMSDWNS
jgi:hypothetical protein